MLKKVFNERFLCSRYDAKGVKLTAKTGNLTKKLLFLGRFIFFAQSLACAQLGEIKLEFDFDINTTWKIKFHQSINSFLCWVDNVDETFMRTHFKLLA